LLEEEQKQTATNVYVTFRQFIRNVADLAKFYIADSMTVKPPSAKLQYGKEKF
jgi:hypothetical protein